MFGVLRTVPTVILISFKALSLLCNSQLTLKRTQPVKLHLFFFSSKLNNILLIATL